MRKITTDNNAQLSARIHHHRHNVVLRYSQIYNNKIASKVKVNAFLEADYRKMARSDYRS